MINSHSVTLNLSAISLIPLGPIDNPASEYTEGSNYEPTAEEIEAAAIERAISLYDGHLPENTILTIEHYVCKVSSDYVFRLQYTSQTSGRTMCIVAKGSTLPTEQDDIFKFYLRQLVLSPKEVAREFSRIAFMEKRARQDQFLALGKLGNPRVSDKQSHKDSLGYKDYI